MLKPLLVLAGSLALAAPLRAQDPGTDADPDPNQKVHLRGVEVRQPDAMRGGDTIQLVGMEQGTNSFRAKTPALSMGEFTPKQLDPDALYQARMAMYGEPGYALPAPAGEVAMPGRTSVSKEPAAAEPAPGPSAGVILLAAAGLCGGALLLRRWRRAREA